VTEIVNNSYSDSNEREEKYQEITPLEETDCLLVEQEIVLSYSHRESKKRKCQAPMGGDLYGDKIFVP
jgi:hypothetical protein